MSVYLLDMPAERPEARRLVVAHGERGRPVDRDRIVVPQDDQARQAQMPGQRGGLLADALHQAADDGDRVGVVIDDLGEIGRATCWERECLDGVNSVVGST